MKNIRVITWYTLREALARKVFIFFIIISLLVLLSMVAVYSVTDADSLLSVANQSGDKNLREIITALELMIISPLAALCLLLSIFASSSFIPIMLEKGTIDLLLSKPVSRSQLLWGKYFGGLLVVFLNIAFLILGVWLIISIKFSFWDFGFLLTALLITFTFAVLYSVIVLFGVITKNSVFGMMIAYFIFLILSPLLEFANGKLNVLIESDFVRGIIKGLYYIIPQTNELMGSIMLSVAKGNGIDNFQPVLTSFLFLVLVMGYADYLFRKKDF